MLVWVAKAMADRASRMDIKGIRMESSLQQEEKPSNSTNELKRADNGVRS